MWARSCDDTRTTPVVENSAFCQWSELRQLTKYCPHPILGKNIIVAVVSEQVCEVLPEICLIVMFCTCRSHDSRLFRVSSGRPEQAESAQAPPLLASLLATGGFTTANFCARASPPRRKPEDAGTTSEPLRTVGSSSSRR